LVKAGVGRSADCRRLSGLIQQASKVRAIYNFCYAHNRKIYFGVHGSDQKSGIGTAMMPGAKIGTSDYSKKLA
jgi:hypothetical protein